MDYSLYPNRNTFVEMSEYFGVEFWEFMRFWNSLSYDEQTYYLFVKLV